MIIFVQVILRLLADFVGLIALSVRPRRSIEAENLFLRRELALYKEHGVNPRRVDAAARVSLAFLSRLFDWLCSAITGADDPRWLRHTRENPLWGEERIANELLVKVAIRLSPRTVRKYMPKLPPGRPRGDQRWSTFLRKHARGIDRNNST